MTEENPNTKKQSFRERCTFDNILIAIIFVGGGAMLVLAGILFVNVLSMLRGESEDLYESVRNLILSMGGVGAAIGLWFANQRQKTLSEQVQTQVNQAQTLSEQVKVQADQSFNERLGRGVELLAKDNVVMRCAGLQVLEDLAVNADNRQKPIVLKIIDNFFRDNAKINIEDGNEPRPRTKEKTTQDLQDALDILISLSINDREKLLPKRFVSDRFNFRKLDFSHLDFTNKTLESVDFSETVMEGTRFVNAIIKDANFIPTKKIRGVDLSHAKIINSHLGSGDIVSPSFVSTTIENSTFFSTSIEDADFSDVEIINTKFMSVEFIGGRFSSKKKMKVLLRDTYDDAFDDLPCFFCTEFRNTEFDFDDEINPYYFFESCYCREDEHLPFLDEDKKYEYTWKRGNVFVGGGTWSGESVSKRVAVEITRRKLENARHLLSILDHPTNLSTDSVGNIKEQEYKVEELEKKLHAAEIDLENDTKNHSSNS